MPLNIERRRSKRVSFPKEIWYRDRNKNNQGFKHAYGRDISEHGLLFETYEIFPQCAILELKLQLPASYLNKDNVIKSDSTSDIINSEKNISKEFSILAEVVRTEEVKKNWLFHIGVSFCKIDNECRQLIKAYSLESIQEIREAIITA